MKFSPVFLGLAAALTAVLAAPTSEAEPALATDSAGKAPSSTLTCEDANKEYAYSVITFQKSLDTAKKNAIDIFREPQWRVFKLTADKLYKTTVREESGKVVTPALSAQLEMQAVINDLQKDIQSNKPSMNICFAVASCPEYVDITTAVSGMKTAIEALSKACTSQAPSPTEGQSPKQADEESAKVKKGNNGDAQSALASCDNANKEYAYFVVTFQKSLDTASSELGDFFTEQKWKDLKSTGEELFKSTALYFENGNAVTPTLSEQLKMQPKIDDLIRDLEFRKPSVFTCGLHPFQGCPVYEQVITAAKGMKTAMEALSKVCTSQVSVA